MTDLERHEIEFVGSAAAAFGSLIAAIQRDDRDEIMQSLCRILNAATRYGNATKAKPADAALVRAVERLNAGPRQP